MWLGPLLLFLITLVVATFVGTRARARFLVLLRVHEEGLASTGILLSNAMLVTAGNK
ncbi:MAG: hypothetical protein HQ552_14680 [Desulfobacteraceae bacterium]|nr:hypothetical protein [Desulfobacteraceae bacterium]